MKSPTCVCVGLFSFVDSAAPDNLTFTERVTGRVRLTGNSIIDSMRLSLLFFSLLVVVGFLPACSGEQGEGGATNEAAETAMRDTGSISAASPFIAPIKAAHHTSEFLKHPAVAFDFNLVFGGKSRLNGTITMMTNSTKVLVQREDGAQLLYDGKGVFLHPADAAWPRARFDALTWSYFFAVPYKLDDPGTRWNPLGRLPLEGSDSAEAQMLTFGENIGDAPDDWYIVYRADSSDLIRAMAYVVTYGKSAEEAADAEPHAIVYEDYKEFSGVPFATRWLFRNWNMREGVSGERGEATISNVRFIEDPGSIFEMPSDASEVPLD